MTANNDHSHLPDNMESLKQKAETCGPSCCCHATGSTSRIRRIIGIIVLVAAAGFVARAMVKSNSAPANRATPGFATLATTAETPPLANETAIAVKEIASLSDLNAVAADTGAVFVFVPAKGEASGAMPAAPIQGAAQTIASRAQIKVGIFSLKVDAPEYQQLAGQTAVPAVLAMVKGRGMSAVSGEITEEKLVQAFVGASSAGGCGPSAGSGCCPK